MAANPRWPRHPETGWPIHPRPLRYTYVNVPGRGRMPALVDCDHAGTDGGDWMSERPAEWVPEGMRR